MAFLKEKEDDEEAEKATKGEFIEEEPAGLVSGVKIKHLAKVSDAPWFALILLDSQGTDGRLCVCVCVRARSV